MGSHLRSPIGALLLSVASKSSSENNMNSTNNNISSDGASIVLQAITFAALCYISLCTYWTLFRINIGWAYTLQGPHLSPPSSLLFNAMYFCRLQFSIGYNFLLFLNINK